MECYPHDIELKLGFDVIRRSIEGRLQSSAGLDVARSEFPVAGPDEASARLRSVSEWQEALRGGQSPGLAGLPDLTEELRNCTPAGSWLEPEALVGVIASLSLARHVAQFFTDRKDQFPALAASCAGVLVDADLEKTLSRIVDDQGNVRDDASPDLRRIRKQMKGQEAAIRTAAERALSAARDAGYDAGEAPTIRAGRLVIPVRVEGRRKLSGSIVDTSASGKTAFLEPEECLELGNELRLLEAQERREIVRILIKVTDSIRVVSDALLQNQHLLAHHDLHRAKAHLANELDAVVPQIGNTGAIRIQRAVNPALHLLRRQAMVRGAEARPIVPLDLTLEAPERTLVISGPNAGGKSVAMKTIGLLALMLSYGVPVPCREGSVIPLFDRLMVSFGDDQSLENDLSTFSSHLESLKRIVELAGPHSLILIDEIGTGTDPAAGEAIAAAVLEHLSRQGGFIIVTTHFGGLKALAHDTPGLVNGAMRFDPDRLQPTYVFEPGVPGSSYALEIAERADFPDVLLKRAQDYFGAERSRIEELILELSKARQDVEKQSSDLSSRLRRAEAAESDHLAAKEHLESSRAAIMHQAHEKAEDLLKEANRAIENTIREIKESQAEKTKTKEARERLGTFQKEVNARKPKAAEAVKAPKPAATNDRPLEPGDSVVLDGGSAIGEILRLEDDEAVVAFELAQMHVDSSRLERVNRPKKTRQVRAVATMEPSLHITPRLDLRGYRVADALPAVEKYLDEAIRAGLRRVEILHGTGTGALRDAIRGHLRSMNVVSSIEEAPIDQGGAGVTYVVLS
ncbi:MAG: Smr/MutS family protein [Rhodothermales bacterium]